MRRGALVAVSMIAGCIAPNPDWDAPVVADSESGTDSVGSTGVAPTTGVDSVTDSESTAGSTTDDPPIPEATTEICTGRAHSCLMREDGSVWCWGENRFGQIGDGTHATAHEPVQVELEAPAADIDCGYASTCAVLTDGSAWCWGENEDGILGFVGEPERTIPSRIPGVQASLTNIAIGDGHACARSSDGQLVCWGDNYRGQSGTEAPGPAFFGGLSAVQDITAGQSHNCALLDDATVRCWGEDAHGRSGAPENEELGYIPDPVDVGLTGVIELAAGAAHNCALMDDRTVWCWGSNGSGQLGPALEDPQTITPVQFGNYVDIVALAAGDSHTCVATGEGVTYCHGSSWRGKLGNTTPLIFANLIQLSAGDYNTCAIDDEDQVWCWGYDAAGELGQGPRWSTPTPTRVDGIDGQVLQLATRSDATCVLLAGGSVQCWGANDSGALGDGSSNDRPSAINSATQLDGTVTSIGVGNDHACALDDAQTAWCWGSGSYGRLGNGDESSSDVPVTAFSGASLLAVGAAHACVTDTLNNDVWCWGIGTSGQLGDGLEMSSSVPVQVTGLTGVTELVAGGNHTCALTDVGEMWCWGHNGYGQLGDGTRSSSPVPLRPNDGGMAIVSLALGVNATCFVNTDAELFCAGDSAEGKLGNPENTLHVSFEQIRDLSSTDAVLSLGASHSCLLEDGTLFCAGSSAYGQVGDGSYERRTAFTEVRSNVTAVATGDRHTCLVAGGDVRCFGDSYRGSVGDGTIAMGTDVPVRLDFSPL